MTYTMLGELPTQVRGALTEEYQVRWMDDFNQHVSRGASAQDAWKMAWHFVAREHRYISGVVSREVIDVKNELVDQEKLCEKLNKAIFNYGLTINEVHSNRPCGVWFDACFERGEDGIAQTRIYGVAYQGEPYYDEFWKHVLTKQLKGLSIGIFKPVKPDVECDGNKCWKKISELQVFEASAVPEGACPGTLLDEVNFSAKSREEPTMTEETNEANTAPESQMSEKGILSDVGIEALQKVLMGVADIQRSVQTMEAKIAALIDPPMAPPVNQQPGTTGQTQQEPAQQATPQPPAQQNQAPPQQGQAPPQQNSEPQTEKKEGEENGSEEEKNEGGEKKEEEKDDKSNKAISPPLPPLPPTTDPVEEPEDKGCSNKQKELADVMAIKERQAKAMTEGTHTERPDAALNDKGGRHGPDALEELMNDQQRFKNMSAKDLDKFIAQYEQGLI